MPLGCILVTGAEGKVARSVRTRLGALCRELRLTDVVAPEPTAPGQTTHLANLSEEVSPALLDGVDAVVHFAGFPREAPWPVLLDANVRAVINLWEAAALARVPRIVYASSNHAVGYYRRSARIDATVPARPDSRYGVTKVFMEALARMFADKRGVRGFGIRIGHCAPEPMDARSLSHWVHPEDLAQLNEVGLTADYDHEIVYGVSANSASWYDNQRAIQLGYRPRHSADKFAADLAARVTLDDVAERYQGGAFAAEGYLPTSERATDGHPPDRTV